jgi:hypothetical protein
MDYIWDAGYNYPISIHITSGDFTKSSLQSLSNAQDLPVRDFRGPNGPDWSEDYYPQP